MEGKEKEPLSRRKKVDDAGVKDRASMMLLFFWRQARGGKYEGPNFPGVGGSVQGDSLVTGALNKYAQTSRKQGMGFAKYCDDSICTKSLTIVWLYWPYCMYWYR